MNTIVNEDKITFKESEQKIFHYVCDLAVNITEIMLESYDRELHGDGIRRPIGIKDVERQQ